ncbi:MAG TPA: polyprenyl diphosphate synthase [Candidatus Acidoferrales bacterium]|nr:polyprenyl diphosphate synthase [Candidatus Acidoferrales bacterium]
MIERAVVAPVARSIPRHVAIIMDGNRRWARERGLPGIEGHRAGTRAVREAVRAAIHTRVEVLTVFAFSEENWRRDALEVRLLMELVALFASSEREQLVRENVRVRILGRLDRLPGSTKTALAELVRATEGCTGLALNLAINYGARTELCDAVRALAKDVASGTITAAQVNESLLGNYLYTAGLPDPDLVIRTGGELRLSNFLLYQAAYSELWSTPHYWPAFDATILEQAIADFAKRQRRFGT